VATSVAATAAAISVAAVVTSAVEAATSRLLDMECGDPSPL